MTEDPGDHAPTAERLLDVRTPAEIAFAPEGSRVAFALHSTVADVGSFVPSDLYVVDVDGGEPVRLTDGAWSDRTPVWSPDGRTVGVPVRPDHAGASAALHDGAGRGTGPRRHVRRFGGIAGLVERRDPPPGPRGRPWLLRARLERQGGDRRGPGGRSLDPASRTGAETSLHARRVVGSERGGRSARCGRVGVRLGRRRPLRRDRVHGALGWIGLVSRVRRSTRPERPDHAHAVRADVADRVALAVTRRAASRGDRGLRERPRTAERQRDDGQPG